MRQVYFGCVDNFLAWLVAARYTDGLRAVVSLLTSGTPRLAGLRSAAVLRLRQFVARVVDNVRLRTRWRRRNLQTYKSLRNHNNGDQQQTLDQPANQHAAIWEHADGRFSGEWLWRPRQCRANRRLKLVPSRRPFDEQPRRLGPLGNRFRNGFNFRHRFDYAFRGLRLV